jgi:photosystem II stability/assembly factor-like uncharacterized protein
MIQHFILLFLLANATTCSWGFSALAVEGFGEHDGKKACAVLRTLDGGRTWDKVALLSDFLSMKIGAPKRDVAVVVGSSSDGHAQAFGALNNGNESNTLWTGLSPSGDYGSSETGLAYNLRPLTTKFVGSFRDVVFHDANPGMGLAVGELAGVYKTTTAGASWDQIVMNPQQAVKSGGYSKLNIATDLNTAEFCPGNSSGIVYAVGNVGMVVKSTDQGTSFIEMSQVPTASNIFGLAIARPPDCFTVLVVGQGGLIAVSVDGAESWSVREEGKFTNTFMDVAFVEGSRFAVAVGTDGVLIRSESYGLTWTGPIETDFGAAHLTSVTFSEKVGIVASQRGLLLSKDSGQSWTKLSQLTTINHILDVHLITAPILSPCKYVEEPYGTSDTKAPKKIEMDCTAFGVPLVELKASNDQTERKVRLTIINSGTSSVEVSSMAFTGNDIPQMTMDTTDFPFTLETMDSSTEEPELARKELTITYVPTALTNADWDTNITFYHDGPSQILLVPLLLSMEAVRYEAPVEVDNSPYFIAAGGFVFLVILFFVRKRITLVRRYNLGRDPKFHASFCSFCPCSKVP